MVSFTCQKKIRMVLINGFERLGLKFRSGNPYENPGVKEDRGEIV
jgi:hypothetical protein